MKKWHQLKPAALEDLKKLLNNEYPTLNVRIENDIVYIRGTLPIKNDSRIIDRYSIEIRIPDDHPISVPLVREIGGRLPKIENRHFNPKDHTACLFFRDERYKFYPKSSTIIDFIKGPVESFFIGQTYYDLTGKWIFGERGHGVNGTVDFYAELLKTKDIHQIINFLNRFIQKKIQKHLPCYCDNDKPLYKCHIQKLLDLRSKIDKNDAKKSLKEIEEAMRQIKKRDKIMNPSTPLHP